MKKFAPLCFVLIVLFIGLSSFTKTHHKTVPAPAGNGQDSTKHHHKEKHHPNVGGSTWSVMINVGDLTGKPISGATVSMPCSGSGTKTTNAAGQVVFGGNAPCPCTEGQAIISTAKGCNVKIAVACDSSYTVNCSQ